jgi:hypothetical protein
MHSHLCLQGSFNNITEELFVGRSNDRWDYFYAVSEVRRAERQDYSPEKTGESDLDIR